MRAPGLFRTAAVRRYYRALAAIGVLVLLAALILAFQSIRLGGFERGGDTPLGLKLGLDLQGGIHLVYQATLEDPATEELTIPSSDQMNALKASIERRVNTSGLGEPIILILGEDRLLIQLPGVEDSTRAKRIIGPTARLEFFHRTFEVPLEIQDVTEDSIISVRIEKRRQEPPTSTALAAGSATSSVETDEDEPDLTPMFVLELTPEAADALDLEIANLDASLELVPGSNKTYASFLVVSAEGGPTYEITSLPAVAIAGGPVIAFDGPSNIERLESTNDYRVVIPPHVATSTAAAIAVYGDSPRVTLSKIAGKDDNDIGLTGDDLARAYAGQHSGSGAPIVNIEFNDRGARIFGDLTAEIAGTADQIAIFLDEEELVAPVVQQAITSGVAFIQGHDFTVERVRDLALLLESGRLPIEIVPILERTVGPSLGQASLNKSVVAGAIGLALVLSFMALYYRVPGVIAAVALIIYTSVLLAVFKIIPVTLTLSGVAAAILSIGMAVDANILIFERMKEELRRGRTLLASINIGFNRAWPAIRDSNVSTLITCAILFWFADQLGAAVVQGFAVTLAIGVGISLFSAIFVSRTFLRMVAETGVGRRLHLFVPAGADDLPQVLTEAASRRS